jgi:hypothetical protein
LFALSAQVFDVAYETDFDKLFVNRNEATGVIVLEPLKLFVVPNVNAVNPVNDFEVGQVKLAKLVQASAGQ